MNETPVRPRIPCATYRLQFNHRFTFRDATAIIGYLHDLGITDIYASPYFKAKPGSIHGYDIVDHNALNPEIGTEDDYRAMSAEMKRHGMGQILDIVPNHMCIDSAQNVWWTDVLENGPSSPYATYFDIDWAPVKKELQNKVLIPVLGDQYGKALESQELVLAFEDGAFSLLYYSHRFPLRPQTYALLLEHRLDDLRETLPGDDPDLAEYLSILTALRHLPPYTETDPARIEERGREKEVVKRRIAALAGRNETVRAHLAATVTQFNGTKGDARSFDLLDTLMADQVYRLSFWRVATEEINYRRFFDINSLGAVRMENAEVFEAAHALVLRLVRDGSVTGLRIDHPDGLYNPTEYFHRLQRGCYIEQSLAALIGPAEDEAGARTALASEYGEMILADPSYKPFYIVGEKILMRSERMPEDWPIFSTTGYVFLNSVNGLFVDGSSAKAFDSIYEKYTRTRVNYPEVLYEKKKLVMQVAMSSEVNMLGHYLNDISEKSRHTRDFTLNSLTGAIIEVIACFPVYRTYTNSFSVTEKDQQYLEHAVSRAKRKNPALSGSIFDFLKEVLLLRFPRHLDERERDGWLDFVMRFQQITGPVMAKGAEDTAFYIYNRLVSLNEVGGSPDRFGTALDTFHGQNIERVKNWPHAMISTDTHDTKRGEDVRACIDVLSEIPREWSDQARNWARINRRRKPKLPEGNEVPDRNEEYLLYQTLVGVWPVEQAGSSEREEFMERISSYMIKACREAKVNTSWVSPNSEYETALDGFIRSILDPGEGNEFLRSFLPFQRRVSRYGMLNSLSQTLLKACSPGVPDFYQGTELWNLSLVDPDNRRPVDYEKRARMLYELKSRQAVQSAADLARDLSRNMDDGRIKLYLLARALEYRRRHRMVFDEGDYLPISAEGVKRDHVCAFSRNGGGRTSLIVAPRFLATLIPASDSLPFGKTAWEDTRLVISEGGARREYENVITEEPLVTVEEQGWQVLYLADLLKCFPVALLDGPG